MRKMRRRAIFFIKALAFWKKMWYNSMKYKGEYAPRRISRKGNL